MSAQVSTSVDHTCRVFYGRPHRRVRGCARYRGTGKNILDLRRFAVVYNLHVITRQASASAYEHGGLIT
jgi:hypothetical protein